MQEEEPISHIVRNGLFLAASRTYGEQYIEPFVRAWYAFMPGSGGDHDAVDAQGRRYEVKACKVLHSSVNRRGTRTLLDRVKYEITNVATNRMVPFVEARTASYDANVQNVKRDHFDVLIYVLLFEDCVKIFWADRDSIRTGDFRGWSEKHGRYDAPGKSGQFAVNKKTVQWHLDNHLKETVTYEEMAETLARVTEDDA